MVGQSGSVGCWRRVMAKAAWILTLGNLSVTRTSMAWWMRSKRSSSICAFSAILPSNLLISWHTLKRTAWLLALWDWDKKEGTKLGLGGKRQRYESNCEHRLDQDKCMRKNRCEYIRNRKKSYGKPQNKIERQYRQESPQSLCVQKVRAKSEMYKF